MPFWFWVMTKVGTRCHSPSLYMPRSGYPALTADLSQAAEDKARKPLGDRFWPQIGWQRSHQLPHGWVQWSPLAKAHSGFADTSPYSSTFGPPYWQELGVLSHQFVRFRRSLVCQDLSISAVKEHADSFNTLNCSLRIEAA